MTKIKICGLRRIEDIGYVNAARPDYVGFILAKGFRRSIDREQMRKLRAALLPEIPAVGVFVNQSADEIAAYLQEGLIDLAQLHGQESDETICSIQVRTGKPVIKAIKISCAEDVRRAEQSPADLVLLDGGTGEGKAFDWSLLGQVGRDFILAGGLAPGNVAKAIRTLRPMGVDVSSGVETDGCKDEAKIKAFMQQAKMTCAEDK